MQSQSATVLRRWLTRIIVRRRFSLRSVSVIISSLVASSLVGSSRIRIWGFGCQPRAMLQRLPLAAGEVTAVLIQNRFILLRHCVDELGRPAISAAWWICRGVASGFP